MRVVLGLEYNGRDFCGWQSQRDGCGIQDAVERALTIFADCALSVVCAGRTDTGVHAWAQVVHLDTELERSPQAWVRGTNTHLPSSVRVIWAHVLTGQLAELFHARFAARSRSYRYLLLNDPVAPAVAHGQMGWFHATLDVDAMREAAQLLVGEHDFSAFRSSACQAKTPVKFLDAIDLERTGNVIVFTVRANAFLHHMVRNIVGALVYVGCGRLTHGEFKAVLDGRQRTLAPATFSAAGLYLSAIEYDAAFGLPAFPTRTTPVTK